MTKPVTVAAVSLALSLGLLAGLAKGPAGGAAGGPAGRHASPPAPVAKLYQERLPAVDAAPRQADEAPARIRLARQG